MSIAPYLGDTMTRREGQAFRQNRRQIGESRCIGSRLSPPTLTRKKGVYKLLTKVRAAIILLLSPWFMKPSDFRPGSNSIYKNLGWGLPLIPGITYAWGATTFYGPIIEYNFAHLSPSIENTIPHFTALFLTIFFIGNDIFIASIIYLRAFSVFVFHSLMCGVGQIYGMQESPPPYEFFLVRAGGVFMWLSVVVSLMALPVLAHTPGLMGHLAADALSVPLISFTWGVLFLVAGFSWMVANGMVLAGDRERVHLKEMYESDGFVKLVWRTQFTISVVVVLIAMTFLFLIRQNLIFSHH